MMASEIKIALEGPGADQALAELLAIPGLQGHAVKDPAAPVEREGGLLAAIGAIVGIVGGIVTVVDKIIAWREKWQQSKSSQRLSVFIEDTEGNRISLNDAKPEEITAVLKTLAR